MKKIEHSWFIIGLVFVSPCLINAQVNVGADQSMYGLPSVQNFTSEEYDSYIQNWGFTQDTTGNLLVANIGSVLEYDGVTWRSFTISNRLSMSIARGNNGKIYIGGIGELGYLAKSSQDTSITSSYHSLLNRIPVEYRDFQHVWDVIPVGKNTFFRANDYLFQLAEDTILVHQPAEELKTAL
jgi:hypothetical protein